MSDVTTVTAMTNTRANSCVDVICDCPTTWSFVQQACYRRLCTMTGEMEMVTLKNHAVRARRIAGTYARFYLEQEAGCDAKHKGRFYWMALGAFASKTVACTLETGLVHYSSKVIPVMREGLGKGNFWLFCDIAGWHIHYTQFKNTFAMCRDNRDANTLVRGVKMQAVAMPWSADALPKIKNHQVSKEIKTAFAKVKEFEAAPASFKSKIQMDHLLAVADHEQGVILQPLIYDDPAFAAGVQLQRVANSDPAIYERASPAWLLIRKVVQAMTPELELVFSSACSTKDEKLKSVAPKDTKLENLKSRMKWIGAAANHFHKLMKEQPAYMEAELAKMAGWYDMPDKK